MRVLISGYSPRTHSSYGTIIRELWLRLIKTGEFEIEQHAWFNVPSLEDVPWKLWPTQSGQREDGKFGFFEADKWGSESFEAVLKKFKPDIVWNLGDIYMSKYLDSYRRRYGFKLVRWTLTEGEPIDRANLPFIAGADKTVAITRYAAKKWKELTGEDYEVIHHGVDLNVFKPVSIEERNRLRQDASGNGIGPNDFLITYVGRNQARKRPWLPFEFVHYLSTGAWGWDRNGIPVRLPYDPVTRKHKDEKRIAKYADPIPAKLWVHSTDDGTRWRYENLEKEWAIGNLAFRTVGHSDNHGLSAEHMAQIYQMSNVLSMVSGSEGFGVPIIEAAACGIPSVYTNYSGCKEVGDICKGSPAGIIGAEPCAVSHVRWAYPDVDEAIEKFYDIHKNSYDPMKYRKIAEENFSHDKIAAQWLNVLREVNERPLVETVGVKI